jgi:hypothetical protein
MSKSHARAEFSLWLEIRDPATDLLKLRFNDVVSFSATHALNSIPLASVTVASGKNVRTSKNATIHDALSLLKIRDKVRVLLRVSSDDPDMEKMSQASAALAATSARPGIIIFDGYYMGNGYQRSYGSASYTLQLAHWLSDLNYSSMLNGNWHPVVPHDLAQAANSDALLMTGNSNYAHIKPVVDLERSVLTKSNMSADLWDKALKPVFEEITRLSHPKEQAAQRIAAADEDKNGNNAAARAALARMPGDAPIPSKLPLLLDDSINGVVLTASANEALSRLVGSNWAYSSFWSKLVGEFAPEFLFAVSPGATFANVVPFFGGLRTPWRTIKGNDYGFANLNASAQNIIESLEIRYPQGNNSGLWSNPPSYYYPWGRFPANNNAFRGQIMIKEPPMWLNGVVSGATDSPYTTGISGGPPADAASAGAGGAPAAGGAGVSPATAERQIKEASLLDRYSEHWYKSEVLGQRYGELSGKLRFDIAPGSIVKIEAPDTAIGEENAIMFAAVVSVSYVIDAEKPAAGTSFTLSSLRTESENDDPDSILTSSVPPLYPSGVWTGGPLVKEAI